VGCGDFDFGGGDDSGVLEGGDLCELVAEFQDCPGDPRFLGGNGDNRAPVAAALFQLARPATEAILLYFLG
jgi:hypothetical protein